MSDGFSGFNRGLGPRVGSTMPDEYWNNLPGRKADDKMKPITELLAGVKDCERDARSYYYNNETNSAAGYLAGHRAACDKLIPALELAMNQLDYYRHGSCLSTLEKIRALLEAK